MKLKLDGESLTKLASVSAEHGNEAETETETLIPKSLVKTFIKLKWFYASRGLCD